MSHLEDFWTHCRAIWIAIRQQRYQDAFKRAPFLVFSFCAAVLVLIGIVTFVWHFWTSSEQPRPSPEPSPKSNQLKILVIGPETGGEEDTWRYIRQGFDAAQKKLGTEQLNEDSIKIEYENDASNPERAGELARRVCADQSYVLALGFVQSGVAEKALQQFTRQDCRLPVILVATTSTQLTRFNKEGEWRAPVLRLPPSNFQQATQIVTALGDTFGTAPCRLVIIKDVDAAAFDYSKNMEEEFRSVLGADKRTHCEAQSLDVLDFEETKVKNKLEERMSASQASVDAVLFFGMTNRATQLLQALNEVTTKFAGSKKKPVIIVSDGSTTSKLIDQSKANCECVWGAFPFGEPRDFQAEMPDSYKHLPSYFAYGYDAYLIAVQLLSDTRRDLSREAIGQEFKKLATEKRFINGMAGRYEFDSTGGLRFFLDKDNPRLVLGQYHLWQVRSERDKLVWDHRKWREPLNVGCARS